ncbi:MAG: undecaprenyl-diphosphate phosphatase [Phycisphaeraceae bacterium]|nr:undecaprenyl-diphosphate phosphatase [Phycisphaerales bacterium]MCB9859506.1 undecaprenyl-diphosphate phosphatase [Phycisphaeraceae bacterium]
MELWQAIVLGLVEGITEYLPISSTGHLIIASSLMGMDTPDQKTAIDAFNIVIQGGAILAVLGLYWQRVRQMLLGLMGKNPAGLKLFLLLITAFLPAAVLGFLLDDWIESKLFFLWPVVGALVVGGIYMILVDLHTRKKIRIPGVPSHPDAGIERDITELTYPQALFIGFLQCIAMWPGTSRSMMTITGGIMCKLRPAQAAEFSFLLGLPTLGGATCYKLLKNLKEANDNPQMQNLFEQLGVMPVVVGIIVAAISAAIAVKWLVGFLNKHGLVGFGIYRILLAIVLFALVSAELVTVAA